MAELEGTLRIIKSSPCQEGKVGNWTHFSLACTCHQHVAPDRFPRKEYISSQEGWEEAFLPPHLGRRQLYLVQAKIAVTGHLSQTILTELQFIDLYAFHDQF